VFIYHASEPVEGKNCHSKIAGFGSKRDLDHLLDLMREGIAKHLFEEEEKDGRGKQRRSDRRPAPGEDAEG
jgi:hypothetical protein